MNYELLRSYLFPRRHTRQRLDPQPRFGDERLIEAMADISRTVRSGQSLDLALRHAWQSQPCDLLFRLDREIRGGRAIDQACHSLLESWPQSREKSDENMILHVLALAHQVGGDIAQHIDSLIDTLVDREAARCDRRTQAATATSSMKLITWLPVVCGAWIISDSAAVRHFLFGQPAGWLCLIVGITLNMVGRWWSARLVSR